jgi:hypothetical protein
MRIACARGAREHPRMPPLANVVFFAVLSSAAASTGEPTPQRAPEPETSVQRSCAAADSTNALHDTVGQDVVEVWIDLSVPPLSSQPAQARDARAALLARIETQQDETMAKLVALGAQEVARVKDVRNAVAVRMPSAQLAQARTLPGVVKVRPVKHRKRMTQCSSRN